MHGTLDAGFRIEWRPLAELARFADAWRALAARALEPNVFYEPAFALASAPVFGREAAAGLVWSRAAPARLLGLFPARIERRRYGLALPVLVGWTHPFAPLSTPLVDRDAGVAVVAAWLEHLAGRRDLPRLLLMPYLPESGAVAQAFATALAANGGRSVAFGSHQRALLAPADGREDYLERAIGGKKRKELRRQRKRLAESGPLAAHIVREGAAFTAALADFLALEASGWKGRAGTAAGADAAIRVFVEKAAAGLAREGKAHIARLVLAERPIAALVTLRSGTAAWCWKIAYDEAFARSSPGVQLILDATQTLLAERGIARVDSCATAGHPMIDHVWRERLALADQLLRPGRQHQFAFGLACTLERTRRAAIAGLKRLRDLARQRASLFRNRQ
jgi:CelD/BcsL family acetyltransferase involved in cellulose biosynthesis